MKGFAFAFRGIDGLRRLAPVAALAMLLIAATIPAHAQSDDELPTRVGRIAESSGDIFLAPEDRANEWIPVGLNYPVTSGDNLWVGGDGRAEVDYGGGQFRLGGDTNLNVSRLDERQLALFIAQGRLVVRVRSLGRGRVGARRHAECPGAAHATGALPDRRAARSRDDDGVGARGRGASRLCGRGPAGAAGAVGISRRCRARFPGRQKCDRARCVRRVERQSRPVLRRRHRRGICLAGNGGIRRARSFRQLGELSRVRQRLVPGRGRARMGALQRRLLDERRRMGQHVGRRGAVGLRAVPLRTLGLVRAAVGMVSRTRVGASGVGSGARRLVWRSGLGCLAWRPWASVRVGSAGLARALSTFVAGLRRALLESLQPAVRRRGSLRATPRGSGAGPCQCQRPRRDQRGARGNARAEEAGRAEPHRAAAACGERGAAAGRCTVHAHWADRHCRGASCCTRIAGSGIDAAACFAGGTHGRRTRSPSGAGTNGGAAATAGFARAKPRQRGRYDCAGPRGKCRSGEPGAFRRRSRVRAGAVARSRRESQRARRLAGWTLDDANRARARGPAPQAAQPGVNAGVPIPPARSESARSVPVPQSSSGAGVPMPAPRIEPARSVPVPQSLPAPTPPLPCCRRAPSLPRRPRRCRHRRRRRRVACRRRPRAAPLRRSIRRRPRRRQRPPAPASRLALRNDGPRNARRREFPGVLISEAR